MAIGCRICLSFPAQSKNYAIFLISIVSRQLHRHQLSLTFNLLIVEKVRISREHCESQFWRKFFRGKFLINILPNVMKSLEISLTITRLFIANPVSKLFCLLYKLKQNIKRKTMITHELNERSITQHSFHLVSGNSSTSSLFHRPVSIRWWKLWLGMERG